jgi:CubicO group peptidase (beta-lactamase class C family)
MQQHILSIFIAIALAANSHAHPKRETSPASGHEESCAKEINFIMEKQICPGDAMPGAMVLVAKNGRILFAGSYGFADIEHKTPFNSESVFDLASCSKQFTAVAILMLVDRGQLRLHDPINKWLPEIPSNNGKLIEVIDLLHMTAGLHEYSNWFDDLKNISNEDVANKAAQRQFLFPIGTKYDYSNTAYALLALLVKRVSGQTFAQFMQSQVFTPLGMKDTMVLDNPPIEIPNRVQGYNKTPKGFKPVRYDTHVVGDGQVFTTAKDLVLWDGGLREGKLLKQETLNHAYVSGRLINGKPTDYGMGYCISEGFGKKWLSHTGGWTGTSTYVSRCLDDGLLVVILSNNEKFNGSGYGAKIERLFEGGKS